MSTDPSVRRLLPQSSQIGQFSFAPTYQQPRETQKNYVFVDEHNRHKRLKVMRACEGCRRRKIKCDAATTNTWPCSACVRLKLHCVRPNGQYEGSPTDMPYEQSEYDAAAQMQMGGQPKPGLYTAQGPYPDTQDVYQGVPYATSAGTHHNMNYTTIPPQGLMEQPYASANVFHSPPMHHQPHHPESPESYHQDQYGQQDLADVLGALQINARGTAPYLNKKQSLRNLQEQPVLEDADDFKVPLPVMPSGAGLKIRIPPELMPDEGTILHYFDLYFENVHPYVPVLNKAQFYQQWTTNRGSISPLLLEAMFAVAGRLADEPAQGQQWIALASKHADSFMDVPRLSTLQALLIILKAREASPKRGYYYRSWMSVVNCVAMAKDLGLDEHYQDHQAGQHCGSDALECATKTRIWQTIFVCEVMIGSPQGRDDLSVRVETLDFATPRPIPGGDDADYHVSRNFTYLARIVRSISRMNTIYGKVKRKKDWGIDPEFVQLNPGLNAWQQELPADLSVAFPPDGSPPWLPNHFIGNLHSYYHLAVIILHRPQLEFLNPGSPDGQWKSEMLVCHRSAKMMCRLQESMLEKFGLGGLQCMQRGISFTIYAILSCMVLHLIASCSPDPDLNSDAREYFTRHMRVLERTMMSWPMPEMVKQIDSVREAFSADLRKPFVLKPSFPYGSPSPTMQSSPPDHALKPPMLRTGSMDQGLDPMSGHNSQVSYTGHPITPPLTAASGDSKSDSPVVQSLAMMAASQNSQPPPMPQGLTMAEPPRWDPGPALNRWDTTFGTQQIQFTSAPQPNSLISLTPSSGAPEVQTLQDIQSANSTLPGASSLQQPQQYSTSSVQEFVAPNVWQQTAARLYEGGLKRSYDDFGAMGGSMAKRR